MNLSFSIVYYFPLVGFIFLRCIELSSPLQCKETSLFLKTGLFIVISPLTGARLVS
jgi:hypothetical protein